MAGYNFQSLVTTVLSLLNCSHYCQPEIGIFCTVVVLFLLFLQSLVTTVLSLLDCSHSCEGITCTVVVLFLLFLQSLVTTVLSLLDCSHSCEGITCTAAVLFLLFWVLFYACCALYFFCKLLYSILHKICKRRVERGDLARISVERDESSIRINRIPRRDDRLNEVMPPVQYDRLNEVLPPVQYKSSNQRRSRCVDCAICLEDFKDGEQCRHLPNCNHMFHASCIDPWLTRNNFTCPICRQFIEGLP